MNLNPHKLTIRLIHDGVQPGPPLSEALIFGLQDTKGAVHPPAGKIGRGVVFDISLAVKPGPGPVFAGPFVHGPPAKRFLYLGWKRVGEHEHPWGWRIKMPLAGITWTTIARTEQPGRCITADVTGRRPHSSAAIDWIIEAL